MKNSARSKDVNVNAENMLAQSNVESVLFGASKNMTSSEPNIARQSARSSLGLNHSIDIIIIDTSMHRKHNTAGFQVVVHQHLTQLQPLHNQSPPVISSKSTHVFFSPDNDSIQ